MEHEPTITCLNPSNSNSGALQRSINNMINIPRTIIHPTPPPTPPLLRDRAGWGGGWGGVYYRSWNVDHVVDAPLQMITLYQPCRGAWYNVINIPRTIIHPTPTHPSPHPALSRSMIQRDHLQRSINNVINIPRTIIHPTPPPTPPRPVAEHDTTWSSAAEQQPVCGHRRTWVPEGIYIYIHIHIYIYIHIYTYIHPPNSHIHRGEGGTMTMGGRGGCPGTWNISI